MTRKELVDAIASSEIRLEGWRSDDQVAMWECEQLAAQISSLYDELASIDSLDALGNRVLENPEDYYDTDGVGNFPDYYVGQEVVYLDEELQRQGTIETISNTSVSICMLDGSLFVTSVDNIMYTL